MDGFDPDKYLAKKKTFDPNAYLASKQGQMQTTSAASTATNLFGNQPKSTRSLGDVVSSLAAPLSYSPTNPQMPQQVASDVRNLGEVGLPFLAQGIPNPLVRALAMGALQGTGTLVGKTLEDVASNKVPNLGENFRQAGISAGLGTAATQAGNIVDKSLTPFSGKFQPDIAKVADKYGVDLPASSLTRSRIVPQMEAFASKGIGGEKLGEILDNAGYRLNKIANDAVESFGKSTLPTDVGEAIKNGQQNFEKVFRDTKNSLYNQAQIGSGIKIQPTQGLAELDKVINDLNNVVGAKPPILSKLKALQSGLNPESPEITQMRKMGMPDNVIQKTLQQNPQLATQQGVDANRLKATIQDLQTKINYKNPNPIVQGYEGRLKGIIGALDNDLDTGIKQVNPQLSDAIDKANTYYKDGITKLNSAWGQKIQRSIDAGKVSELPKTLLTPSTPVEAIPNIYKVIGDEGKQSLQASTLEKIFENARNPATGVFQPQGLARQIKQYGVDKLNAIFSPEMTQKIQDLSTLSFALGKGEKIASGSQTAFIARVGGELVGLGLHPLQALKLIGSDAVVSKFIASPIGQKFLTEGFVQPTTARAIGTAVGTAGRVGTLPFIGQ